MDTLALGKAGEDFAARHLKKLGWRILERNWRHGHLELDIIGAHKGVIIFVEVKTRKKESLYRGAEAVDKNKRIKIIKTAMMFLSENNIDLQPRFDVVEVTTFKNKESQIIHFENAFDIGECDEIF